MNAVSSTIQRLPLDVLTLDADMQPRSKIDTPTYEEYAQHLGDGGTLPPVLVVFDGERHWLVDGYHRWHAHKALGLAEIEAEVRAGTADDAIRLSLQANAEHGKRREPSDFRRAYAIAVRYNLVTATDSAAVKELLRCGPQWARDLTRKARDKVQAARDAQIKAKQAEGKTKRQIAKETGVAEGTVRTVLGGAQERATRVSTHSGQGPARSDPAAATTGPIEADPEDPRQIDLKEVWVETPREPTGVEIAKARLAEMETPRAQRWHKALAALRAVNEQATVKTLFAGERYDQIDHVFGPELKKARTWINALHKRYFDE